MFFDQLVTELSTTLSVGSLLFFVAVYAVVSFRVFRYGDDELDERARMALDPPTPQPSEARPLSERPQAHAAIQG